MSMTQLTLALTDMTMLAITYTESTATGVVSLMASRLLEQSTKMFLSTGLLLCLNLIKIILTILPTRHDY